MHKVYIREQVCLNIYGSENMDLQEKYSQMCMEEGFWKEGYDYHLNEHKIILWHNLFDTKQELYDAIDRTRRIINKHGFWYTVKYSEEERNGEKLECQIFTVGVLNFDF